MKSDKSRLLISQTIFTPLMIAKGLIQVTQNALFQYFVYCEQLETHIQLCLNVCEKEGGLNILNYA